MRLLEGDPPLQKPRAGAGTLRSSEALTFDSLLDVGRCPVTEGDRLQPQAVHGKLLLVHSDMKLASGQHRGPQPRPEVSFWVTKLRKRAVPH